MRRIETNDFAITNLKDLTSRYRLYRIRGLNRNHDQYYANLQHLVRRLSYRLKKPVTTIERGETAYLVARDDVIAIPTSFSLVRTVVYLDPINETFDLNYTLRTPENDEICRRFLQFMLQESLYDHRELWQPKAGGAFFRYSPNDKENGIAHYLGFNARVVVAPDGGLALRVHIANKYLGARPLPDFIGRDEFEEWRGRTLIYHFGYRWYEIRVNSLMDLNVMEYGIPVNGENIPLLEYVVSQSRKPIPPELARVPVEGSVISYLDNRREERAAPSSLCHPVHSADDYGMGNLHRRSLLPPFERNRKATEFVRQYLTRLKFGSVMLNVDTSPIRVEPKVFQVPDLKFGNSQILSLRGTEGAMQTSLRELGRTRAGLLKNRQAGFYHTDPLDRQYFILPQSVMDSYGVRFMSDLSDAVDDLFPQERGYQPIIVTYNDRVKKTLAHQGNAIREAIRAKCRLSGYAVVMIHEIKRRKPRGEDELAAMTIRELRDMDVRAAIIHSTVSQESYVLNSGRDGEREYIPRQGKQRGKLSGYLNNVALNKVLLNNERWPFVLATPLHASIVIGIDVKSNTAGLVVVGSNGEKLQSFCKSSKQKEQLTAEQIEKWLKEILTDEASMRSTPLHHIVIHRDGKVWPSEIRGAKKAIEHLKQIGILSEAAALTIVEITKNPQAPQRFFEISNRGGKEWIENPEIGYYRILGTEGFICTTGRSFPRNGTVEPLSIRHIEGPLPLEQCLEDVFSLSALALTKPDDCSRYPITIKLNDRALADVATDYDEDALEYADSSESEEDNYESDSNLLRYVRRGA